MASLEDEIKDLRENNNDLVQKVQYWKMTAAQRENEKLELMKEINQLRLKLSRIRSGGTVQARKLEAALQAASEEALSHLVQASGAVAGTIELAKKYFQERQELDASSPRWSNISGTPTPDKIHKVPPMMIGGRSIQPVVSLRRASFSNSNLRTLARSPNQNRSMTERAVPMHMLQDVYIPLTRIDAGQLINNDDDEMDENNLDDSTEILGLENDNDEQEMEISHNSSGSDGYDDSRRLDAVTEDVEPEDEPIPQRTSIDNPLEGPSWLLDIPHVRQRPLKRVNLEPDSTTELYESQPDALLEPQATTSDENERQVPLAFTPTVRRRKRSSSPTARQSPARRHDSGRILKVLVAKMKLDGDAPSPKRASMNFNVPSPNGATDNRVIVLEGQLDDRNYAGGDPSSPLTNISNVTRREARRSRDSNASLAMRQARLVDRQLMSRESTQANEDTKPSGSNARERSHGRERSHARERSHESNDSRCDSDSDVSERTSDAARSRRPRKPVTYREVPLNVKMRR